MFLFSNNLRIPFFVSLLYLIIHISTRKKLMHTLPTDHVQSILSYYSLLLACSVFELFE